MQWFKYCIPLVLAPHQELEKKRREERMRQKLWEQKHRLGSFRRRARLPGAVDTEAAQMEEERERDRDRNRLSQLSPLAAGLGPSTARRPSFGDFAMREAQGEGWTVCLAWCGCVRK